MARESDSSVRIGSITIFALVIVLCISVMGMLSVSTGRAALASSEKLAVYTSDIYQNEKEAWQFVSEIDESLYDVKSNIWWYRDEAISAVTEIVNATDGASIEDGVISARFASENGKTLTIKMTIDDDLELNISEWRVSTSRDMDNGDVLWSGI